MTADQAAQARRQRRPLDYYELLGVRPTAATPANIKAAWRRSALENHPDRFPDPVARARATAKFQDLQAAYSVLSDPARRRAYDDAMMRRAGARAAAAAPRGQARAVDPLAQWAVRLGVRLLGVDFEVRWRDRR